MSIRTNVENALAAQAEGYDEGYNAALNDCIGLLRKWFWGTNKEASGCEQDMRKLMKDISP